MFNRKNISQKLFGLSVLTTVSLHNINEVSAESIKKHSENQVNKTNKHSKVIAEDSLLSEDEDFLLLAQSNEGDSLFNFNYSGFEGINSETENPQTKLITIIALSFFLLLFVPFGIFYPFFLFYKRLLNVNDEIIEDKNKSVAGLPVSSLESTIASNSLEFQNIESDLGKNAFKATVSKLQIAFSANNKEPDIRQQLTKLCSSIDPRTEEGTTELMKKTISLIDEQNEVTHVSCNSESFNLEKAKEKFEIISAGEKNKLVSEKLDLVNSSSQESKVNNSTKHNSNSYVIVTLVFCTSKTKILPQEINTRKQLGEVLLELSKINQDQLIKFDLFWNPEEENTYLNNSELLLKYIDMMRLL